MKPLTAAKKLGVHLPATPEEFRAGEVSHERLRELQSDPPDWLRELRRTGPHPRPEVARRLGVTIAALKRNDMDLPLTTEEIRALLADPPEWLREARAGLARRREEDARARARREGPAAEGDGGPRR